MRNNVERIAPLLFIPLVFTLATANAETCEETLQVVQQLYASNVDSWGDNPASNCSGLMIRATTRTDTTTGPQRDVWNPGERGAVLGTSAFSYMRKDITYDKPGRWTENGYIKTPIDFLCGDYASVDIQCAFPKDAWTDGRTQNGCGDNIGNPADPNALGTAPVEKACQDMGINSGQQWLAYFNQFATLNGQPNPRQDQYQCGFGLSGDRSQQERATAFKHFMEARKLINTAAFRTITEIRVANPEKDQMPILAFFNTTLGGGAEALKNQQDYLNKTGRYRPIITIKFPTQPGEVATFSCAANQLPPPPASNSFPGFCRPDQGTGAQCPDYIKSVKWVSRKNYYAEYPGKEIWALEVTLNDCAKQFGPEKTDAVMAEMKRKALAANPKGAEFWGAKDLSMRRQAICLNKKYSDKTPWYLESIRPNEATQAQVNEADCNHR